MYVFDTDVLSLLMKGRLPEHARDRLRRVPSDHAKTTAITLGELHYGALRSAATARWLRAIESVASRLDCLPFDALAAERYGEIRSGLEKVGRRLADPDLRIAAICLATDYTLISGNTKHFARVPGLKLQDWIRGGP